MPWYLQNKRDRENLSWSKIKQQPSFFTVEVKIENYRAAEVSVEEENVHGRATVYYEMKSPQSAPYQATPASPNSIQEQPTVEIMDPIGLYFLWLMLKTSGREVWQSNFAGELMVGWDRFIEAVKKKIPTPMTRSDEKILQHILGWVFVLQ